MHMFNTIHRLVKFFGFGGLRHILEACNGGCEIWGAQWAVEGCGWSRAAAAVRLARATPAVYNVWVVALPQD